MVTVADDGGRVRLTVDDSGPGIPEEERARIFDRFHRATESTSGAGLGLAIADAIVRTNGGRWRVAASPAGGASLSVAWKRETFPDRVTDPTGHPGRDSPQPVDPRPDRSWSNPKAVRCPLCPN